MTTPPGAVAAQAEPGHARVSSRWHLLVCLFTAIGLLSISSPAAADSTEYGRAVSEGVREFEQGNFEEARALFSRAHAIQPNARTSRGLGLTEFERRNYVVCIELLEAAIRSTDKPLSAALRADTERVLERARGFVATVRLRVHPSEAEVLVDGEAIDLGKPLMLQAGAHVMDVHAEKFVHQRRTLSVKGGEELQLAFTLLPVDQPLEPLAVAPPHGGPAPDAPPVKARSKWYRNPWFWSAVGVVVAGGAVGTGLALGARGSDGPATYGGSSSAVFQAF